MAFFPIIALHLLLIQVISSSDLTRLTGGRNEREGRVEVMFDAQWGTVCSSGWNQKAAQVVCNELGFNESFAVPSVGIFNVNESSDTSTPIWLNAVDCLGTEKWIGLCKHANWGENTCKHNLDAGVSCLTSPPTPVPVRLAGSNSSFDGRVEVQILDGRWAAICDDGTNQKAAQVVCNQLGLNSSQAISFEAGFLSGGIQNLNVSFFLESVSCIGNESNIWDCPRASIRAHDCGRASGIAGVVCSSTTSLLPLRLVGGKTKMEGRVEMAFAPGHWGTICGYAWEDKEAQVICNQLGFVGTTGFAFSASFFNNDTANHTLTPLLSSLNCLGTESWIGQCLRRSYDNEGCSKVEAGVACSNTSVLPVRLSEGATSNEGRLEIQLPSGQWGTVCDNNFGTQSAQVVCKQLGFSSYKSRTVCCASYSNGTGNPELPIVLYDVYCKGSESWIGECNHARWGSENYCHTSEQVGVVCGPQLPCQDSASRNEVSLPLYKVVTCSLGTGCPTYAVPINSTQAFLITANTTCANPVSLVGSYSKPDSGQAAGLTMIVISHQSVDSLRVPLPKSLGDIFYVTISMTSSKRACDITLLPHIRGDGKELIIG